VLQFCLPLLCGVNERISRRQIAVIQRDPLSYREGSVPAYLATYLFCTIHLHLTTILLDLWMIGNARRKAGIYAKFARTGAMDEYGTGGG
jgi:hypothetical protein